MDLHKKKFRGSLARKTAPIISRVILMFRLTNVFRQLIAFLNYCLGRGAGMGWALTDEVSIAVGCIQTEQPVVFDVGGNIGNWSKEFRSKVADGKLFIFEPQKGCQKEIKKKNIPNSELVCVACGKEKSTLIMYSSSEIDGSASFHERGDSCFRENDYQEQAVDVISLGDFASERGIEFIDYIKFDIEGHELVALEGLHSFLASKKIGGLSFEFGSGNLNSNTIFRDFWDLLCENYNISIITPSGKLKAIDAYYEDLEFYRGVSNFVAILK